MIGWLRRLLLRPTPPHYGIASVDVRGKLRFDVKTAISRGLWADEIAASQRLGAALKIARAKRGKA